MIWQVSPLKPHIASGAVKPIAALSAVRIASFPDVPTIAETLLPGFDSNAWFGVLAPAGTPGPVVERLYGSIRAAMGSPAVAKQFENLGLERADVGPAPQRHCARSEKMAAGRGENEAEQLRGLAVDDVGDWLQKNQGVAIEPQRLADPARSAARIGALAREQADLLPFDTDPTAFWRHFDALTQG
jgi:hypothetical protein